MPSTELIMSFQYWDMLVFPNLQYSYLLNRRQYTVTHVDAFAERIISSGVPQGSVLGPILFFAVDFILLSFLMFKLSICYIVGLSLNTLSEFIENGFVVFIILIVQLQSQD